jgi:hypothetical protein
MKTTNLLTPDSICNIIKACSQAGVNEFVYGGLKIRFGAIINDYPLATTCTSVINASNQASKANAESLLEDEVSLREKQISEAILLDPVGFEEMIKNGDLGDAESDDRKAESEI